MGLNFHPSQFRFSVSSSPTRFLSLLRKFLLADSILTLRCTLFNRSYVTYVAWKSGRVFPFLDVDRFLRLLLLLSCSAANIGLATFLLRSTRLNFS